MPPVSEKTVHQNYILPSMPPVSEKLFDLFVLSKGSMIWFGPFFITPKYFAGKLWLLPPSS
jgi:hypothetical protein